VKDTGWREGCGARTHERLFVAHLDLRFTFENDVEFVLAGVRMRCVGLAGLETV
jgi:hypothetical protein